MADKLGDGWMYGCPVRLLGFLWARRNLLIKCKRAASLSLDSLPPPPLRSAERGGGPSPSRCNRPRPANNNEIHKSGRGQGTFEVLVDLPCKPREPLFFLLLLLFLFLFLRIYSLLRVVHFSNLPLSFFSQFLFVPLPLSKLVVVRLLVSASPSLPLCSLSRVYSVHSFDYLSLVKMLTLFAITLFSPLSSSVPCQQLYHSHTVFSFERAIYHPFLASQISPLLPRLMNIQISPPIDLNDV